MRHMSSSGRPTVTKTRRLRCLEYALSARFRGAFADCLPVNGPAKKPVKRRYVITGRPEMAELIPPNRTPDQHSAIVRQRRSGANRPERTLRTAQMLHCGNCARPSLRCPVGAVFRRSALPHQYESCDASRLDEQQRNVYRVHCVTRSIFPAIPRCDPCLIALARICADALEGWPSGLRQRS